MTHLFQEDLRHEPFWLLVGCVLCNRTRWTQAAPVFEEVRLRWPTHEKLSQAQEMDLITVVRPLGLHVGRSSTIIQLATLWSYAKKHRVRVTSQTVSRIPGLGKYAADSYAIFVEGRRDVEPDDLKLKEYLLK